MISLSFCLNFFQSTSGTGVGFTSNVTGPPVPPQPICEALYSPVKSHPALHHTPKETDIEKFAQDNLNLHSKGIFRKKVYIIYVYVCT